MTAAAILAALLALLILATGSSAPRAHIAPPLTIKQAKRVAHAYARERHLAGFRIVRCRRRARTVIYCRVHEAPYLDLEPGSFDTYLMGVARRACHYWVRDGGSGSANAWGLWL